MPTKLTIEENSFAALVTHSNLSQATKATLICCLKLGRKIISNESYPNERDVTSLAILSCGFWSHLTTLQFNTNKLLETEAPLASQLLAGPW